jgi:hypothetical protein
MKTILAAIVSLGFVTSVAVACPHEENAKVEKKENKDAKQAEAPKPAPKAPAPAPAPKPAEQPKADSGKVSQK